MSRRRRHGRKSFAELPSVYRPRRNFNLSHRVLTTMDVGKLTPIDIKEVLPGDTWSERVASLTRLTSSFIHPIMDNMFLDTYSFFVPLRLCQTDLEDVFGDSSPNAYAELDLSEIAYFRPPDGASIAPKSVGDYLGLPVGSLSGIPRVSALPFRAFALIWNEFFRNQTVDNEVNVLMGNLPAVSEVPNANAWSETNYTGMLPPVSRYKDYFSTAVVAPQKGPAVTIPGVANAPVVTSSSRQVSGSRPALTFADASDGSIPTDITDLKLVVSGTRSSLFGVDDSITGSAPGLYPTNLITQSTDAGTINALRTAFQMQKYLERDSIFGSRYIEYLYAAYGVYSPDARLQVPEFLSGSHNRITIQQQVITANGTNPEGTAQTSKYLPGNVAGYAQSMSSKDGRFSKSFTEHGYIITVGCIRYKHLYSQAVSRLWTRTEREHFYDPLFSNLGQQAIYKYELYGLTPLPNDGNPPILGYQEAWADYRTIFDRVTAGGRPGLTNGVGDYWSLADVFSSTPSLVDIVHETDAPIDRVVSVLSLDPFVVDFAFEDSVARVVTAFSIPGYADHH